MKKFVSILLLTAVVSTSVFAVPFNAALLNTMNAATEAQKDFDDFDVEGTELTEAEMSEAEGEGWFSGLVGGILSFVMGGVVAACTEAVKAAAGKDISNAPNNIWNGMWQGALGGFTISFLVPSF